MDSPPLVSVITPVYNAERYLAEAIDSVRTQTYHRWELLLVDDGSTDGSAALAERAVAADRARIRLLSHPDGRNRGASASRNLALRHAQGELIAFLDADDVWLVDKLSRQVPLLEAHREVGLLYSRTKEWHSWTGRPEDRGRDKVPELGVPADVVIMPPEFFLKMLSRTVPSPCTCSVLVRRRVLLMVGGFEEQFRHIYTDQALYAKLFLQVPVYAADGCWDYYRQHDESSYARVRSRGHSDEVRQVFLQWLESYLIAQRVTDTRVWRAVGRELRPYRHPVMNRVLRALENLVRS